MPRWGSLYVPWEGGLWQETAEFELSWKVMKQLAALGGMRAQPALPWPGTD